MARSESKRLAELVEVRALQRRSAEMALARAELALRQEQTQFDQIDNDLHQSLRRWQDAAQRELFDIALVGSFAAGVVDEQRRLVAQQARVQAANQAKANRAQDMRAADGRHQVIKEAARTARRRADRRADEASLSMTDDILRRTRVAP